MTISPTINLFRIVFRTSEYTTTWIGLRIKPLEWDLLPMFDHCDDAWSFLCFRFYYWPGMTK